MNKHTTHITTIASIISLLIAYPALADIPNTFVAGQAASAAAVNDNFNNLDSRVTALESINTTPTSVAVDCGADADALKNTAITANTTYNISGACTGPIYVEVDNVHLLGGDNATDSIVLPSGLDESAVWAGGAYNLQVTNLFIDLTATTTANSTAGIWARSAFVRLRDSRITGGSTGINPFRGAVVRLDGTNSITEFVNSGLNASDQSNINIRGPVTISSTRQDDQYMKAVAAYRGANIDIRSGITVSVPMSTDARAVNAEENATIRIRNSGTVELTGDIYGSLNSSIRIEKGTINGDIDVRRSASLELDNSIAITGNIDANNANVEMDGGSISGDIDLRRLAVLKVNNGSISGVVRAGEGSGLYFENVTQTSNSANAVRLTFNSTLSLYNSSVGHLSAFTNSSVQMNASTINGAEIVSGSYATLDSVLSTGNVSIFSPAALEITNGSNLNGNNLYGCNTSSFIDNTVTGIANAASAASDCRPDI